MSYNEAYDLASKWHDGLRYGQGSSVEEPYINHLTRVADQACLMGGDEIYQIVGVLHDILEDTRCSYVVIYQRFGPTVGNAVRFLTHVQDVTYPDYLLEVRRDPIARIVKIADLLDNITHCLMHGNKYVTLLPKYVQALQFLTYGYK